ncbi:MAG: hypothetical protein MJ182_03720 [Treponema sp.]|nr:hypothetical protein [Treponema sp.]
MKKLLTIAAAAVLGLSLVSCGSTGGSGAKKQEAGYVHPMTYTLDLSEGLSDPVMVMVDNSQYGTKNRSTRQDNNPPDWSSIVKPNRPQVGDTVRVIGRFTSDMDIDHLYVNLVDNSPAANYWTRLTNNNDEMAEPSIDDIKAGVPVDVDLSFEITAACKSKLIFNMAYGEQNGGLATFTFEKVGDCDIGTPVGDFEVKENHKTPKVYEFDLSKDLAYVTLEPNYPWVNGAQDTMADPVNYQAIVAITSKFDLDYDWPIAGDTIKVYWKTRSNNDISALHCRAVENTADVPNWWKEIDEVGGGGKVIAENIKNGEVTEIEWEMVLSDAPISGISLCIWNDLAESDGSSLLTYVRE